jgi:hypothetical protein
MVICAYFCCCLYEKTDPLIDQLGAMEFLCALPSAFAGLVLVLYQKPVAVVLYGL